MARDSKLWEEAYAATSKTLRLYDVKTHKSKVHKVRSKPVARPLSNDIMILKAEYEEVARQVIVLLSRKKQLRKKLARLGSPIPSKGYQNKPIVLYALRLHGDCYYVGMTRNMTKRFRAHQKGKGATWTKLHPPIEILEVRETGLNNDADVALLEDELTIEYARRFGPHCVRGGGYCQTKPRWPDIAYEPIVIVAA